MSACYRCGVDAGPGAKLCGRCQPKSCDVEAGGCGRTEESGAVLRDGSALCGACEEAIAEVASDDAAKLEAARAAVTKDERGLVAYPCQMGGGVFARLLLPNPFRRKDADRVIAQINALVLEEEQEA